MLAAVSVCFECKGQWRRSVGWLYLVRNLWQRSSTLGRLWGAVAGNDIWVASEYVAQTCTYAQYLVSPRGQ